MGTKKKLNINDLSKVSGGFVTREINREDGLMYAKIYTDETYVLVFAVPLFGEETERFGYPSDDEVMACMDVIDRMQHALCMRRQRYCYSQST